MAQTAQEFLDSWDCPDCGNQGVIYVDGEEWPCLKCESAHRRYQAMKRAEKRMVVAVTPLTVRIDPTWHSCHDCDNAERGACERHDYLNTVHSASVYQGV